MEYSKLITLLVILVYFSILIGIGIKASMKIKTASDYILAGRNLGFWMFILLITGSAASGMTILGVSGLGFTAGWPTFWEQICVPLSCAVCMILFGVKLSRLSSSRNYHTIEDYFCERYYSQRSMRLVSSISVVIVSLIYLIGQFVAVGMILEWLFPDLGHVLTLVIGASVILAYVLLGGLKAIASVAFLQVLLMIAGVLIICPMIIAKAPDFNAILANIDQNMINAAYPQSYPPLTPYSFMTPAFIFSFVLFVTLGLACAPHIVNNVLAVKNQKYFKWAPLFVFLIYFVVISLVKVSGFAARALAEQGIIKVDRPDRCFIVATEYVLKDFKVFWVLTGAIVLSAVMTTTDRLMLTIGNCISWDIYKKYIHKAASDKLINIVNRVTILIITIVGVVLAINPPKLLAFLIWAGIGIMFASFATPLMGGLYWKRATKEAAIASMIIGFISAIGFGFVDRIMGKTFPVYFGFCAFLLSLVVFIFVSYLTQKPSKEVLDLTETGLFIRKKNGN